MDRPEPAGGRMNADKRRRIEIRLSSYAYPTVKERDEVLTMFGAGRLDGCLHILTGRAHARRLSDFSTSLDQETPTNAARTHATDRAMILRADHAAKIAASRANRAAERTES
jgi:hypothetical protein